MNKNQLTHQLIFFLFFVMFWQGAAFSQNVPSDTLKQPDIAIPDTILSDAATDTSIQVASSVKKEKPDLEGPIKYWAESIDLSDDGNIIVLKGDAKIIYLDMTLTAAHIKIDRKENTLYARGVLDSIDADSNYYYTKTPVFEEKGEEPLNGEFIEYNFKTKRGKIFMGKTKMDPGYYKGKQINKIGKETLLVKTGYFTSCENIDNPHYYFKSTKMRVKIKDKVIAKPIYFYIADVPVMWLPFGIFPNKRGRHSGIVIPKYGENRAGGRFLRGMGYYWAPNDYFDASFLTDFYDKLGFTYRTEIRYTLRYKLNGSLSGEYYPRDPGSGKRKERWRFRFRHNHIIDPTLSISGSGSFMSDRDFSRQLSPNVDDRLNQNISSNLSLRKRWKGTKNSMTLSLSQTENLQTGRVDYTMPSLTFNRSQTSIYETITGKSLGSKRSWYQNVYFSYNTSLIRRGSKVPLNDSTDAFTESKKEGMQHRLSFSSPQKIFKYFNITPSLSYREDWVNEVTIGEYNSETQLVEKKQKKQFAARRIFNVGAGVKTTLYGLFEPNIGSLKFIRHKLDPSISYTYTPDFSSPWYGYFTSVRDSSGTVIEKIDRFSQSPFGGTSRSESQRMSIGLGNVFQAKLINDEGKEKKIDLLTVNFSSGYNFLADSLKWSNLATSIRTKIFGKNISVRATHSFYKPRSSGVGNRNEFENFPRLLTLSTSFGFTINNKTFSKKEEKQEPKSRRKQKEAQKAKSADELSQKEEDKSEGILKNSYIEQDERNYMEETKKISIPWSTSFNINYSLNRTNVKNHRQNIDLSARASLQLTKNWKISWNARVDLKEMEITTQSFSIYRDLHCWEMSFDWQPTVGYYSFQINIKSSVLQDIKVTKHPSRSSYIPRY